MKKITLLCSLFFSGLIFAQAPTSAPAAPTEAQADVISVFSDAFTGDPSITPTTFGQSGNTAQVVNLAGNDVYEFSIVDGDFQGFEFGSALNLSAMENLHYDIWIDGDIPVGNVFNTTVSYHAGGHLAGQTTGYVHTNATIADGDNGQWLSFDISFSNFAPDLAAGAKDIISQMVFSYTNYTSSNTIYLDNIYFWREAVDADADASLSDLTLDGTTIDGFSPAVTTYDVELPFGTSSAPSVNATATQAGNGSSNVVISQASGVPGTATVAVTAPNGTDTETYTINFTEAEELPPAAPVPGVAANAVIPILTNNTSYSDVGIPNLEPFNATREFYDLDNNGADDTFSLTGGSGGQINYFGSGFFVDITAAGVLHFDFYAETLNASDNINVVLLGSDPGTQNQNFRVSIDETRTGEWQSFEIGLSGAGSGLTDVFNGTDNSQFTELALVQFNTLEQGSTLPDNTFFISNVYFRGGTLSTSDLDLENSFSVYPNPASTQWTVKSSNVNISNIEVYNTLGRLVQSTNDNALEVNIDASNLSSGIYFAKINSQTSSSKTIKLIKR